MAVDYELQKYGILHMSVTSQFIINDKEKGKIKMHFIMRKFHVC